MENIKSTMGSISLRNKDEENKVGKRRVRSKGREEEDKGKGKEEEQKQQSSRAWRYRGVSGSLARSTHDLSPTASRQFPILGDTAVATCAWISSLDSVQTTTAAHTMHQS